MQVGVAEVKVSLFSSSHGAKTDAKIWKANLGLILGVKRPSILLFEFSCVLRDDNHPTEGSKSAKQPEKTPYTKVIAVFQVVDNHA